MENATDNYELLTGITFFAMYFGISLLFLIIFKTVYGLATPHAEWKLIKEDKNTAAAVGFGGAIIGFSAALAGAVEVQVDGRSIWFYWFHKMHNEVERLLRPGLNR